MPSTPTTIVRAIELISRFGHLQAHEAADVESFGVASAVQ